MYFIRDVRKTLSKNEELLAVHYFCKKIDHGCLVGSSINLCFANALGTYHVSSYSGELSSISKVQRLQL